MFAPLQLTYFTCTSAIEDYCALQNKKVCQKNKILEYYKCTLLSWTYGPDKVKNTKGVQHFDVNLARPFVFKFTDFCILFKNKYKLLFWIPKNLVSRSIRFFWYPYSYTSWHFMSCHGCHKMAFLAILWQLPIFPVLMWYVIFIFLRFDLGFGGLMVGGWVDGRGLGWILNMYESTQDWSINKH